jgi:hypothetical protein
METLGNKFGAEKGTFYECNICDFVCCKKYSWDRHILTSKHQKALNGNVLEIKKGKKGEKGHFFSCHLCNKTFKTNSGLWKHNAKNNCEVLKAAPLDANKDDTLNDKTEKLIEYLMKENKEIKELILEIVKNGVATNVTNSNNTINHTNSHNKAFNLNFFLNETCKNAMNINDFVDSIKLQLSDLIEIGEIGYVEGISKIIVKNLNNLDETERPIHCTDRKRETFYIKDQGLWNKEDEKKTKLTKAVKRIADKNIKLLPLFREKYPEYNNSSSKVSDKYDKMVIEVMTCDDVKDEKIVKNISNVTTINKG